MNLHLYGAAVLVLPLCTIAVETQPQTELQALVPDGIPPKQCTHEKHCTPLSSALVCVSAAVCRGLHLLYLQMQLQVPTMSSSFQGHGDARWSTACCVSHQNKCTELKIAYTLYKHRIYKSA